MFCKRSRDRARRAARSRLVCTLIVSAAPMAAHAQWTVQSANPTDRDVYGIAAVGAVQAFTAGHNHHVLETTDQGTTWRRVMASDFGTNPFYAVEFPDPQHGYITGNNDEAYRTVDGGASWQPMTSMPAGSWRHLDFISAVAGFAGANGACVFTSDGGATWQVRSGYPTCPVMYGMDFRDANVGLAGGRVVETAEDGIFKTSDGGVTWTRRHPQAANDVVWLGATTALATVGTQIYRSVNSGDTWTLVSSGITTGLVDLEAVDAGLVVGVSGKGDIWRSADAGTSWTMVFDGLGNLPAPWSVAFFDAASGWVGGQGGMLLHSHDGGVTWTLRSSGVSIQLYDVAMWDERYGLVAGHDGYLLRTTDGGAFWEAQKLEVTGQIFGRDEGLKAVSIVDADFAVTAGPGGTVFRTHDAATTWESVGFPALPGTFYIEDVEFADRSNGWLVGLDTDYGHNRTVYRTTNGGDTWTRPFDLGARAIAVDFADADHGWIATIDPVFMRTTDGGASWLFGALPLTDIPPSITDMDFVTRFDGWAVGWDGYVAHSTDGGTSWALQDLNGTADIILAVHAASPSEVWLTGREVDTDRGLVYHTTDAGQTWQKEIVGEYPYIPAGVCQRPGGNVWIAGYAGRIQHHPGITVAVRERSTPLRLAWLGGAANPFNPSTAWRYVLPGTSSVRAVLYDVRGRVLSVLFQGEQGAGLHMLRWDGRMRGGEPAGSGTYFMRIESAFGSRTEKLTLVR